MDISDGHTPGPFGDSRAPAAVSQSSADGGGASGIGNPGAGQGSNRGPIHPRLLAMMMAARYYGLELDPGDFRLGSDETAPTAAALSKWAQNTGMWSRALRLR
ncbi:hypothetical protein, partial [Acidisphaera sp. S103]|uniref:hypothetical protein n=1 Tax=Acidisphaera sp. S103 TaxID=1747223 RepID=UPI001C20AF3E